MSPHHHIAESPQGDLFPTSDVASVKAWKPVSSSHVIAPLSLPIHKHPSRSSRKQVTLAVTQPKLS